MAHISIEVGDKTYTLEYTRDALVKIEKQGFSLGGYTDKVFTSMELMFWGSLMKHHKGISLQASNLILDQVLKEYELETIVSSLNELIECSLTGDKLDEDSQGKQKKRMTVIK